MMRTAALSILTDDDEDRWVPKVHPLTRDIEPEDPMELISTSVAGDPQVMLECILQEFVWMGWGRGQLLRLFHDPNYPLLNQLRLHHGDAEIERQVDQLLDSWGVMRFRETLVEPDDEPCPSAKSDLVQLAPLKPGASKKSS